MDANSLYLFRVFSIYVVFHKNRIGNFFSFYYTWNLMDKLVNTRFNYSSSKLFFDDTNIAKNDPLHKVFICVIFSKSVRYNNFHV